MNLFQELRQRRVPQITSGYIVGGWGLLQFLTFLESRMAVSPNLVNLIGVSLLLLLPSIITLAWVHGKPGKDTWGRTPKVIVPANILAIVLLLGFMFNGRDLGAVTQTIAVEDEHGAVIERVIPKSEYRRRVLLFYPECDEPETHPWIRETMVFLLGMDLSQDEFVEAVVPGLMTGAFQDAGSSDGHGLPRPLQRKLARDAHISYFLTGTIVQEEGQWRLETELHDSESGKIVAHKTQTAASILALTDLVSRQVREDLGIPTGHLNENTDLPVADMTSADIEAVTDYVQAETGITHHNDWAGAISPLEKAVTADPQFTLAQFFLFAVRHTLGDTAGGSEAITAAMENIYRVPERLGFLIKSQYYFNEKRDADKALAVLNMWSQIYPNDIAAYQQMATFYFVRQDLPRTIAAYEKILEIDPSRVQYLEQLAGLHKQLGNLDAAEDYLKRYVEFFPSRADGYQNLADFYTATGRLDDARQELMKAQLLEPEDLNLTLGLIDLDIKNGKFNESRQALLDLQAGAETTRDRYRTTVRLMNLVGILGQTDLLIQQIDLFRTSSLEIMNPVQANLVYALTLPAISRCGRSHLAQERLAAARDLLSAPYNDLVGVGQAMVDAELGQVSEAKAALAAAVAVIEDLKFETFRPNVSLAEGMIAEAEGDLETAVAHFRQALDTAIQVEPVFRLRLARALRLAGQEKEALAVLTEAAKYEPSHPWFQLESAQLHYQQRDQVQARQLLNAALATWADSAPDFVPAQEARQLLARLNSP